MHVDGGNNALVISCLRLRTPDASVCLTCVFLIIRWHRWKSDFAYCDLRYRSVVCLSVCLSVCSSVCQVRALCSNGRRYRHNFFCIFLSSASTLGCQST